MTTVPQTPEAPAVPLPEFSDAQIDALVEYMEAAGKSRAYHQGADFSEVDFLTGCMTTLFALGRNDKVPAAWVFGIMAGRSPLDLPTLDQHAYVVHDPRNRRAPITLYTSRNEAEEHAGYLNEHGSEHAYYEQVQVRHALLPAIARAIEAEDQNP